MRTSIFTLSVKKSVKLAVFSMALIASSALQAEAQTTEIPSNLTLELVGAIEQTIVVQTQELLANTQQELQLSLQTQLAESAYEINSQSKLTADRDDLTEGQSASFARYDKK